MNNDQIKVGTIAPIAPIILPEKGIFENRINQFENLKAIQHSDDTNAIDFWIALTRAQSTIFSSEENHRKSSDNSEQPTNVEPFLKPSLTPENFIPVLKSLIHELSKNSQNTPAILGTLQQLLNVTDNELMHYAEAFMALNMDNMPAEYRPFIGAALQLLLYTQAVNFTLPNTMQGKTYKHHCPCCAMPPIASVIDPADNGLRYLACSLCETKWHYVRSKCHECEGNGKLELITIEESNFSIKAECCKDCKTYIKHLDRTKNPSLDLFVEDLASLDLDFALTKEGYHRTSINYYLG